MESTHWKFDIYKFKQLSFAQVLKRATKNDSPSIQKQASGNRTKIHQPLKQGVVTKPLQSKSINRPVSPKKCQQTNLKGTKYS